jgi:hypothetical protein
MHRGGWRLNNWNVRFGSKADIEPLVLIAVNGAVKVEHVGEFVLKGIGRPPAAYNVLGAICVWRTNARTHEPTNPRLA